MERIDYNFIKFYQEEWINNSAMPKKISESLVSLGDKLIEKASDNNNILDNITLFYPEDCDNYQAFMAFASAFDAIVFTRQCGGYAMCGWGLNKEVNVE